jgi:O-succinylbenzoate synthase
MTLAYEELIDFILAGHEPEEVIDFKPSAAARQRVSDLIYREKTTGLTAEETSELNNYMHLEHIMRLAKAKARQIQPPAHE